ncbi:hypothetical protein [Lacticaseibacillus rhamnosus]|uniref:hypothetical protein n=1 Tax=Lacticaseibacillus rhamnosus TaxID=47715 RepID=UPI0008A31CAA|nr:hypothetical protein [Lacticaseibacillus rhamnosus]MDK7184214.1 hypothetical protein [Lacticaseibacillus rhamnosus]MDK7241295.1 hypothetical protein [Lacticaseibacillus rhamnosus]MDT8865147.1 hypothetical protein [Lacticaseibacillus rhamnosus]OFN12980.1 hypothetical protein HMPREF2621_00825 [Lactobacillus sp. HMSC072E07]
MANKQDGNKQIELLNLEDLNDLTKHPREKQKPALESKNTEASASVFGWEFQIVAGITLSLKNIKDLKYVEIEGSTEDIELYFERKEPEYIQAKSVHQNPLDAKDAYKATLAMNTLINTSNITKGKYSKLVYVSNLRNPLSLTNALLEASWVPNMGAVFTRSYQDLPVQAKKFIDKRIKKAQEQLKKYNYLSSKDYFDLNKLYVTTILFDPDRNDEHRYSVLEGTLQALFESAKIKQSRSKISHIRNLLLTHYLSNASSDVSSKKHVKLTKEMLVWRIIFELINEVPEEFYEEIPSGIDSELDKYTDDFIKEQAERIGVINKITSGLVKFTTEKRITKAILRDFVTKKWKDYRDLFPLDEDPDVQEYGIKLLMVRILNGKNVIAKFRKETRV